MVYGKSAGQLLFHHCWFSALTWRQALHLGHPECSCSCCTASRCKQSFRCHSFLATLRLAELSRLVHSWLNGPWLGMRLGGNGRLVWSGCKGYWGHWWWQVVWSGDVELALTGLQMTCSLLICASFYMVEDFGSYTISLAIGSPASLGCETSSGTMVALPIRVLACRP